VNGFAYISDACDEGGIVIYSWNKNTAWRFNDPSTHPTVSSFTINGYTFAVSTPSDGIALSPDTEHLFYSPLASLNLFSIPTAALQDQTMSDADRHTQVPLCSCDGASQ